MVRFGPTLRRVYGGLKTTLVRDDDDLVGDRPAGSAHDAQRASAVPVAPAAMIARRYLLDVPLGRGGHGDVWEAVDTLSADRVAVKLLGTAAGDVKVRKEVSALRLVRVPGVVRLLDEGFDDGRHFLVMERVCGRPFPGETPVVGWESLATVTTALLETLARIHAAGVVHRDIKPSNVLVNDQGRPIVLDFGLAVGALGDRTVDRGMVGTPIYMAPEQLSGEATTARTDLFALGVMLYESLSGNPPYLGESFHALAFAKVFTDPKPLIEVAPHVPHAVASLIDEMIARAPSRRPASAVDVLRALRGEGDVTRAVAGLPHLGGRDALDAARRALDDGQSVDIVGPHGSGRSQILRDLGDAMRAAGHTVLCTTPGIRPFGSLPESLGAPSASVHRFEDAMEVMTGRLATALSAGAVLLVDDTEQLDQASAKVLSRCRAQGRVVCAVLPETSQRRERMTVQVVLQSLGEHALRDLFAGPERVFHLQTDAASALWVRTQGWPARVADEVSAWTRAGLARRDGDRYVMDREALDHLAAGQRIAPLLGGSGGRGPGTSFTPRALLDASLEDTLTWLSLAWPHTTVATLAAASGQPAWMLDAELLELEALGAVRRLADERWEPQVLVGEGGWDAARRSQAHRALAAALTPGTVGRLVHLVAGAEESVTDGSAAREIAREAMALARVRSCEGRLGFALAALAEGILAARRAGDPGEAEGELLGLWVALALDDNTARALDRVRYELCCVRRRTAFVQQLESLVAAAQAWPAGGDRGLDLVEAIAPFNDRVLEMRRHNVRIQAARRTVIEREERAVEEAVAWSAQDREPAGRVAEWRARLLYRQRRFEDAAALLAEAARQEADPTRKLSFIRGLALQLMEMCQYKRAAAWLTRGRVVAASVRNVYAECFFECLLGMLDYRMNAVPSLDPERVQIAVHLGDRDLEASAATIEATAAARLGRRRVALEMAARARGLWATTGWMPGVAVCRAVQLYADETVVQDPEAVMELATVHAPPGIAIQLLALLALRSPVGREACRIAARPLVKELRPMPDGGRLEVLSPEECLAFLGFSATEDVSVAVLPPVQRQFGALHKQIDVGGHG